MALDTSIYNPILNMPQWGAQLGNSVNQGFQLGQAIQQAPMRNRLLEAQTHGAEQTVDLNTQKMQVQDLAMDWAKIKPALESGDMQRANVLIAERINKIQERGGDPTDTIQFRDQLNSGQFDPMALAQELDASLDEARGMGWLGTHGGAGVNQQFGAQSTFKDEEGNLFFGTQKRNPQTGQVESVLSPVGNAPQQPVGQIQMVGQYGLTSDEELNRRKQQAQDAADIDVNKDLTKLTGKAREERIIQLIDTGISSAETIPTYERMLELIDTVSTGGVQAGIQRAGQLFGWQSADVGELDALFKEAVLSNLRKMGANPTEGERQFLIESSGSITQSPAVLKRLIGRRLSQAEKARDRGLKYAQDREDNEAIELMGGASTQPAAQPQDAQSVGRFKVRVKQ